MIGIIEKINLYPKSRRKKIKLLEKNLLNLNTKLTKHSLGFRKTMGNFSLFAYMRVGIYTYLLSLV